MLVFAPPGKQAGLPYLDETVDVVVLASADPALIAEARRVAASALIRVDPSSPERSELEWLGGGSSSWGEDASVTLIPDADAPPWDATLAAFAGTLDQWLRWRAERDRRFRDARARYRAARRCRCPGAADRGRRRSEPCGARSRGHGAPTARIHVFITAPSVPLPDWLPSILALFSPNRDAGVVGPRVLDQLRGDLRRREASLPSMGRARRRGSGDNHPDRPEYRFVQRVDFCSPPLLATHRDLFTRLAGFDERRVPAEALVDFSLRAGQAGAPVYYQPQARLVTIGDGAR